MKLGGKAENLKNSRVEKGGGVVVSPHPEDIETRGQFTHESVFHPVSLHISLNFYAPYGNLLTRINNIVESL